MEAVGLEGFVSARSQTGFLFLRLALLPPLDERSAAQDNEPAGDSPSGEVLGVTIRLIAFDSRPDANEHEKVIA